MEEHGVDVRNIEGIIWSHWHWDHIGDPSSFEKSTALIVGPGTTKNFTPGYPANEKGWILESDYEGRELKEIAFDQGLKIGGFDAFDYFGDGSFYLLDSPGHAIGHMCGLAKVTSSPKSFILMGGDICHHPGQFRPSPHQPLPSIISPNPSIDTAYRHAPGPFLSTFSLTVIARGHSMLWQDQRMETRPHLAPMRWTLPYANCRELEALDEVLVVIAHDTSLLSVIDFFPNYADDFLENGWARDSKWLFLKDFAVAVKSLPISR